MPLPEVAAMLVLVEARLFESVVADEKEDDEQELVDERVRTWSCTAMMNILATDTVQYAPKTKEDRPMANPRELRAA